jgi:HK97 gp10 family phage protein
MTTAMQTTVQVEGLRELRARLKALPPKLQGPPARHALHAGAKVIKQAARNSSAWSDDTGFLRENIVQFSAKKSETQYDAEVRVGVRKRRTKRQGKRLAAARGRRQRRQRKGIVTAYYWKYLEFGTSRMAARPFMRPAFEANKMDALNRIIESLRVQIDKAAAKA